jgi:hypothetical protein
MAQRRRFSFLRAVAAVVVMAAAGGALYFGLVIYPAYSLNSPTHQRRECAAAVDMASDIVRRFQRGLSDSNFGFNPVLSGFPSQGARQALPAYFPNVLRPYFISDAPLDCSSEFSRNKIPLLVKVETGLPPPGQPIIMRYSITRIVFSTDGKTAYANWEGKCVQMLCGFGYEVRWLMKNGKWVREVNRLLWNGFL